MLFIFHKARLAVAVTCLLCSSAILQAGVVAKLDAAQFDTNGFAFGDFNSLSALDTFGGVLDLTVDTDIDSSGDFFGGLGSDLFASFDINSSQIEIVLEIEPGNAAGGFNIVLADEDGAGAGDEFQYFFDISSEPVGQQITLTQQFTNPGPVFVQPGFGLSPGDGIQNYGLTQIQLQSLFGGTDVLDIRVDSISIIDTENTTLTELSVDSFNAAIQSFTFGTFSNTGAVDTTNGNFVITADPSDNGGPGGGLGFNGLDIDFEATEYQLEVEAKLLGSNTASEFNVILGDNDGDDLTPMNGSEDFIFTVNTSEFNSSDFSTFTLPLGSGSESNLETTFGFTNGGDGLQNFDLSQIQFQSSSDDPGVLGIELVRVSIVELQPLEGDYNADGIVDAADYTVWRDSQGSTGSGLAADGNGDEVVDSLDYDLWVTNFGSSSSSTASASSVPEPTSAFILMTFAAGVVIRRFDSA